MKKIVVIGMLGTTLDQHGGKSERRWDAWRPTVSLGQHDDLLIDRLELLFDRKYADIAGTVIKDIAVVSPETTVNRHFLTLADPWDFEEVYGALYDFAEAYPFDTEHEDYLVHITTGTHVIQICLFLLTESRHIPAKLIQTGVKGKQSSPAGTYSIIDLDLSRYDRIAERFRQKSVTDATFLKSGIETRNVAFNEMIARIEKVGAESTEPILLTGPTGAGKSRLAKLIYELRRRRRLVEGAFVTVNCATLRGDMAMSALFGHKKGAFTGAAAERTGLLREADSGVLFLDEVGELGLDEQSMLLRAIEEKSFYPLGSDTETRSNFQLICGTNQDLGRLAVEGRFRQDLLSRINLWSFCLPSLRERLEDIEPNLDYELELFAEKTGRLAGFNREARELFLRLATGDDARWTGNFRDLSAAVMRMGTLAGGGRIDVGNVREEWERLSHGWRDLSVLHGGNEDDEALLREFLGDGIEDLDLFDIPQLACVIRECGRWPTLSEAGRHLFGRSRQAKRNPNDADRLRKYLARFGLAWDEVHVRAAQLSNLLEL